MCPLVLPGLTSASIRVPCLWSGQQRRQRPLGSSLHQLDLLGSTSALRAPLSSHQGPSGQGRALWAKPLRRTQKRANERARRAALFGADPHDLGAGPGRGFCAGSASHVLRPCPASWSRSWWPAPRPAAPPAVQCRDSARHVAQSPGRLALRRRALTELAESAPSPRQLRRRPTYQAECRSPRALKYHALQMPNPIARQTLNQADPPLPAKPHHQTHNG